MIEVRHLRSLVAIPDSGKLVAAAARVRLSQSALSHRIRDIEERYGVLVLANEHRLRSRRRLNAEDLRDETLITYPVPETRIDLIREVLEPAGIKLERRTAELTIAIMQLVASRRGVAALPNWGVKSYVDHDYVLAKRVGAKGLWSELYAVAPKAIAGRPWFADFVTIVRDICATQLDAIELLSNDALSGTST